MIKYRLKDIRDTVGQSEELYHAPVVDKEIERLVDINKAKGALIKAQAKKIGVLLKEKEWLIDKYVTNTAYYGEAKEEAIEYLKIGMQQALKEAHHV